MTLQKQTAVEVLMRSLAYKLQTLSNANSELSSTRRNYSAILQGMGIANANEAMNDTKARVNLLALQKALAYEKIITDEYSRTYDAYLELEGVNEQLKLDMVMLNSLDEENFDKLLEKLDDVLVNVQPLAHELVIGEENIELPGLNTVWLEHVTNEQN